MNIADEMWMRRVLEGENTRLQQYKQAWDAYSGKLKRPLKVKRGKPDDNVIVNFVRIVVDTSVALLFGKEPRFELSEVEQTAAEEWLERVWRANRKMQFLHKVALNGALYGHVFVKIVPREPYPKLVNLSPEYVHVIVDPDDVDEVIRYIIQYPAIGRDGQRVVIRQVIERREGVWVIIDQISERDGPFVVRSEDAWPYQWPPVIDAQNLPSPNEFYGIADVEEDVIDLNNSINFVLSNMARIIRYHAHPKTWGKGFRAKDIKSDADEMLIFPSPDAELHNLEMQSDLSSSIELYRQLKESLHEIARTPEVALGKLDRTGNVTGLALQILYRPLLEKTNLKRTTYGEMLVELNRRLLETGGFGDNNITKIHWPELLPKDAKEEREVALLDQQLGVSDDTILRKLGYDPDTEKQKREATTADMAEKLLTAFDRGE